MSEETKSTPKQEASKSLVERLRSRCVLRIHAVMGSQLAFYIQSIGFSFILIGINYLIFQERLLGQKAVTVEKYVNEAVKSSGSTQG